MYFILYNYVSVKKIYDIHLSMNPVCVFLFLQFIFLLSFIFFPSFILHFSISFSYFFPFHSLFRSLLFLFIHIGFEQGHDLHLPKFSHTVQSVSRRLFTAAVWVRSQVRSCEISGGQSGTEVGFLRVLRFPLPIIIPPTIPLSVIILSPTLYSLDTDRVVKQQTSKISLL
jgi:hypothetical protein